MEFNPLPHDHGHLSGELRLEMPKTKTFETVSELMKMMSDGKRIQIFWLLCHCEECVSNISAAMEMSDPAVSHHLKVLRNAGLIVSRRDGKEIYYKLADTLVAEHIHQICEEIFQITCPLD